MLCPAAPNLISSIAPSVTHGTAGSDRPCRPAPASRMQRRGNDSNELAKRWHPISPLFPLGCDSDTTACATKFNEPKKNSNSTLLIQRISELTKQIIKPLVVGREFESESKLEPLQVIWHFRRLFQKITEGLDCKSMAQLLGQWSSTALAGWTGGHKHNVFQSHWQSRRDATGALGEKLY